MRLIILTYFLVILKNFIINVNKPSGICSTKTGAFLKKIFGQKKIGHLGTLDPLATGVLPFFAGKYTKLIPYFQDEKKCYIAKIWLGANSDTLDVESKVSYTPTCLFSKAQLQEVLQSFQGAINQETPLYSALKYQGKPAYYYARKKIPIPSKKRIVSIFNISLLFYSHPKINIFVECSKGCYIRSLAADIGKKLGTTAILETLERTQIGKQFTKKNIVCLDEVHKTDYNNNVILKPWDLLSNYTLVDIDEADIIYLQKGQKVRANQYQTEKKIAFAFWKKTLVAVGCLTKYQNDLFFQPKKLLI